MRVRNCRLFDGSIKDIFIQNGKIVEIIDSEKAEDFLGFEDEVIDAKGDLVLPGIIDPHTHLRDPGLTQKEDFETGTRAAIRGGVTTLIDMPNTIPPVTSYERLMEKREIIKGRSYVDYALNFGGSRANNRDEIEKARDFVASTKVFLNVSTGDMLVEDDEVLNDIFAASKKVSVHAEGEMVQKAIDLARKHNVPLYLCHISKREEVEAIRRAKMAGEKIYAEATPHHLLLNLGDVNASEENKLLLRTKPEIKTEDDNRALWEGIMDGTIDTIGTDHAPHLKSEKLKKLTFGMPGVESSLEMMLRAFKDGKIELSKIVEIMCENPARIFGFENKGKLEVGYDGDLVVVDLDNESKIEGSEIVSKAGWSPYVGRNRGGRVMKTILRGNLVYSANLDDYGCLKNEFYNMIGREIDMRNGEKLVAKCLLEVGAVKLNVKEPFTFVSGIKSPIYCDNRMMIGFPKERAIIVDQFIEKLKGKDFDLVAGTATAGIPWAAFIAERLGCPMSYIRGKKKDHGTGKQIEGAEVKGKKVIVIEDLISTGGSSIKAAQAVLDEGASSVEVISIFSYGFKKAIANFAEKDISWGSLSNFNVLLEVAHEMEILDEGEIEVALENFRIY